MNRHRHQRHCRFTRQCRAAASCRAGAWSLTLLLLTIVTVPSFAQDTARSTPAANPADVASVDAIIAAVYDVISGPAGQKRNWDRFRSLFAPGARLIPTRQRPNEPAEAVVLDAEGYIQRSAPRLEQNGFFEKELFRKTELFGRMAHVFSTYASYRTAADTAPFSRGINSMQLFNDGTRWWFVTIYWDAERPGLTLPKEFLPP